MSETPATHLARLRVQYGSRYLHWSWWRRRHHAGARCFHHRARLRNRADGP
jgi:hypothetical protein